MWLWAYWYDFGFFGFELSWVCWVLLVLTCFGFRIWLFVFVLGCVGCGLFGLLVVFGRFDLIAGSGLN